MKKTKTDFIGEFLVALLEAAGDVADVFLNTPYKGFRMQPRQRPRFQKGVLNLQQRGIIQSSDIQGYRFTTKGRGWFTSSIIKYWRTLKLPWDGKWRIVMFDVPNEKSNERNIFRQRLKSLGFQMLQKSVFVIPYPCEEELSRLCRRLKLQSYVNIIVADSVGFREDEMRKLFVL